jgi:hypothetical protein
MNLIEEHRSSRKDSTLSLRHEFKLRFKRDSRVIYGFVEGKDDPCFYRGFIESQLPDGWKAELWTCGGRDNVVNLYSKFDWRAFKKEQILFFVDKDLTKFTSDTTPIESNLYITDNYSIENDIVNSNVCDRLLREICGFTHLEYEKSEKIISQFEGQLKLFQDSLTLIMSHIIYWRINNMCACLDDIYMKHIFQIKNGNLIKIDKPKNKLNEIEYIYGQCNLSIQSSNELDMIHKDFVEKDLSRKFIRGKYLLWFVVEFCLSIQRDCLSLDFVKIEEKPKMVVNLSQSSGITQIAPRGRMPETLGLFLKNTMVKYINKLVAA